MQKVLLTMKFYYCLVVLISLNLVTVVPTSKADPTTSEVYESMLQRTTETFDMMKVLVTYIGKIVMHPLVVSRAMPTLKDYLPNLVGTVLASVIETLIEFGNHLVKWIGPFMSSVEISERSLSNSFIGRFLHWDILDTVLRFTRIPRNCQAKAACEAGAYVLHRNKRVAGFLKAIRAHFSKTSKHWPAAMQGLRGEVCADLYQECARNFIMATPTAGMQKPQGIKNHTVKNDAKK